MDAVLCDVVEIDACHMILGLSRQFDVYDQQKDRDNVYIFFKDDKKIVLKPMQEEAFHTST